MHRCKVHTLCPRWSHKNVTNSLPWFVEVHEVHISAVGRWLARARQNVKDSYRGKGVRA